MDMTKEALKLFIQSLPAGSKFEIISFGSNYTVSSKSKNGYINDDKNVKSIKSEIDEYSANMGGTEIYQPLEWAIKNFLSEPKPQKEKFGIMGPVRDKFLQIKGTATGKQVPP